MVQMLREVPAAAMQRYNYDYQYDYQYNYRYHRSPTGTVQDSGAVIADRVAAPKGKYNASRMF